jgi:hypothetical protein
VNPRIYYKLFVIMSSLIEVAPTRPDVPTKVIPPTHLLFRSARARGRLANRDARVRFAAIAAVADARLTLNVKRAVGRRGAVRSQFCTH